MSTLELKETELSDDDDPEDNLLDAGAKRLFRRHEGCLNKDGAECILRRSPSSRRSVTAVRPGEEYFMVSALQILRRTAEGRDGGATSCTTSGSSHTRMSPTILLEVLGFAESTAGASPSFSQYRSNIVLGATWDSGGREGVVTSSSSVETEETSEQESGLEHVVT